MKLVIGGIRGTSCIAQPDFMKYGGETTSVLIEGKGGERVIIDAGTGIRQLGARIEKGGVPNSILLLITHYHLDHVIGLPSFSLLFRPGLEILISAPLREERSPEDVVPPIMAQPYWPVQIEDVRAEVDFLSWEEETSVEPYEFGGLEIRWCPVHHPGGCTAYRIDEKATGASLVFATDVEWSLSTPAEKSTFLDLCRKPVPAHLLLMDGHFDRKQYEKFVGWGHSTWQDDVEIAREAGIGKLLVIHHAPQSDDSVLEKLDAEIGRALPGARLARGGMEIEP